MWMLVKSSMVIEMLELDISPTRHVLSSNQLDVAVQGGRSLIKHATCLRMSNIFLLMKIERYFLP